ncbi:MAG: autotransporter domain-containing protein [Puniceicoccales bacterium]|jgi:uncharacterized protein YhjY with autotransporter beta-barrel domain/subtilisin family serine protease|nr:autotransporter domain-containing protein [Puniceicoccales bacterium]
MSKLPLSLLVAGATLLANQAFSAAYLDASFYPNDTYFPYTGSSALANFPGQWHLENLAPSSVGTATGTVSGTNAGLDVNIVGAWRMGVVGKNVVIGIVDDGIEGDHEDLAPNYRADLSKMFSSSAALAALPQRPYQQTDNHGTAVAGVAAARGGNGIGGTGAAPYAQLAGGRISPADSADDPHASTLDFVNAFLWKIGTDDAPQYKSGMNYDPLTNTLVAYTGEAEVHISNNSYSANLPFQGQVTGNIFDKQAPATRALTYASANNTIFVFAAGNWRGSYNENTTGDAYNGSEPIITVAALGSDGVYCAASNFGANVFVTAPSDSTTTTFGITTTDRIGPLGYNTYVPPETTGTTTTALTDLPDGGYTSTFGGTSSASPLVAGILALGKQVAPAMDVRLAKHALVHSSRIVDASEKSNASLQLGWVKNAAGNWFNPNYGFGLIDATAFVRKVIDIAYITDRTQATTGVVAVNEPILVRNSAADDVIQVFTISAAMATQPIESVETRLKLSRPAGSNAAIWQDLQVTLTSPSGTVAGLILFNDLVRNDPVDTATKIVWVQEFNTQVVPSIDWWFTANNFWGENAAGDWTLSAANRGFLNIGGTITWEEYEVIINMGKMVLENESQSMTVTNGTTIKAHSLNLDTATFTVAAGGTFTVTDSVNVYGGEMNIYGTVDAAAPDLMPEFSKGSKLTILNSGVVNVWTGGSLTVTRGIQVSGGYFGNHGTLTLGTGPIIVNYGGTFRSAQSLELAGALLVGDDPATTDINEGTGIFEIRADAGENTPATLGVGSITLGGGSISVADAIHVSGNTTISAGTLSTGVFTGAEVTINGNGTLTAQTLTASGTVAVDIGGLNVRDKITAPNVNVGGQADWGQRGWISPGGFGRINTVTDSTAGTRVVRTEIEGNLTISEYGVLLIDAQNGPVRLANGVLPIQTDTLHVKGMLDYSGALSVNRIADKQGNLPRPVYTYPNAANYDDSIVSLITVEPPLDENGKRYGLPELTGFEIDNTYASIAPTLRYKVYTRDWKRTDADGNLLDAAGNVLPADSTDFEIIANGEVIGRLERDYAPIAVRFTANQRAVGASLQTLWQDFQTAKGWSTGPSQLGPIPTPGVVNTGSAYTPPVVPPDLPNEDILASVNDHAYDYIYTDIFDTLDGVPTDALLQTLYDQLSPLNSVILGQSLKQQLRAPLTAIRARARDSRGSFLQPGSLWTNPLFGGSYSYNFSAPLIASNNSEFSPYTGHSVDYPVTLWLNGGASFTPGKKNNVTTGYDTYGFHGAIGFDYRFSEAFAIGVTAGYSGISTDFNTTGVKSESDSIFLAAYATGSASGWYYTGSAGGTFDGYSLKRSTTALGDAGGSFKGSPDGNSFFASFETGYEWLVDGWAFGPLAGVDYSHSSIDSYREGGDSWQNLAVDKQTIKSLVTRLGARVNRTFDFDFLSFQPELRAEWVHEFEDDARSIGAVFNVPGARRFAVQSLTPTKDYANVGLSLSFLISRRVTLTAEYDCFLFVKDTDPTHQVSATLRFSF